MDAMKETEMVVLKLPSSNVSVQVEASKAEDISHIEGRWWTSVERLRRLKKRTANHSNMSDGFSEYYRRKVEGSEIEQCWRYHLNSMIVSALVDTTLATRVSIEKAKVDINGRFFHYISKRRKRISFEPIMWPDEEYTEVSF